MAKLGDAHRDREPAPVVVLDSTGPSLGRMTAPAAGAYHSLAAAAHGGECIDKGGLRLGVPGRSPGGQVLGWRASASRITRLDRQSKHGVVCPTARMLHSR